MTKEQAITKAERRHESLCNDWTRGKPDADDILHLARQAADEVKATTGISLDITTDEYGNCTFR